MKTLPSLDRRRFLNQFALSSAFFTTADGEAMQTSYVRTLARRVAAVSGVPEHEIGAKSLRIGGATDLRERLGAESGRVMCIALHPYIMGQPHRISYLDEALSYILSHDGVWKAKGDEIADWYAEHCTEHYEAHLGKTDR